MLSPQTHNKHQRGTWVNKVHIPRPGLLSRVPGPLDVLRGHMAAICAGPGMSEHRGRVRFGAASEGRRDRQTADCSYELTLTEPADTHTHREPRSLLQTIKLCTFPSENHPAFNREGCQRLGVIGKIRAERFDIFYETLCSRSLSSGSDASVEYNFAQSLECWTTQRGKHTFHFFELKNESSARHRRLFWHAWNFWGSRGRKRTAIIQKTRRCCGLN